MNNFKKILLICFILGALQLSAQQSGFRNYGAFLLNIKEVETGAKIHELKISLVYDDGSPVVYLDQVSNKEIICGDPYLFWENEGTKIPSPECKHSILYRRNFKNAGDHYICVVPMNKNLCALSHFAQTRSLPPAYLFDHNTGRQMSRFFLHVKIEDMDGSLGGGRFATQQVQIPIGAAIPIDLSNLDGTDGVLSSSYPIRPLEIFLKPNDSDYKAAPIKADFGHYIVPVYKQKHIGMDEEFISTDLESIQVIDEQLGKSTQRLYSPASEGNTKIWREGSLELLTWNQERVRIDKMFRVPADWTRSEPNKQERPFMYYHWNEAKQVFEIDTLFNNRDYIRYNEQTKKITAVDFLPMKNGCKKVLYDFNKEHWQITKEETFLEDSIKTVPSPAPVALCFVQPLGKELTVRNFGEESSMTIVDTFWISNYGNKTAELQSKSMFFIVPPRIEPKQTLFILYERTFQKETGERNQKGVVSTPMQHIQDNCLISYDKKTLSFNVNYFMLKETAQRIEDSGAAFHFNIPHKGNQIMQVYVNSLKQVLSFGNTLEGHHKIGVWQNMDFDSGVFNREQTQKLLSVQLLNDTLSTCDVYAEMSSGLFVPIPRYGQNQFVISSVMKLLKIKKGSRIIILPIYFEKAQEEETKSCYLLEPNQTYYYENNVKVPLDWGSQQFRVFWNSDYLNRISLQSEKPELLLATHLKSYQEKFPHLRVVNFTNRSESGVNGFIFDLSQCGAQEKKQIKAQVEKDKTISFISFLIHESGGIFCGLQILVYNQRYISMTDSFKLVAQQRGFIYKNTQSVSYDQHIFDYKSKVVDEAFFDDYNYLCEHAGDQTVHLNRYGYAEPDIREVEPGMYHD